MKKIFFLITAFSVLLFVSCRGANSEKEKNEDGDIEMTDEKIPSSSDIVVDDEISDLENVVAKKLKGSEYIVKYEVLANEVIAKAGNSEKLDAKTITELEKDIRKFNANNELDMDSVTLEDMRKLGEIQTKLNEILDKMSEK